jgi:hypothetical protein
MLASLLQVAAEAHHVSPLAILAALLGLQVLAFFWSCYPCCDTLDCSLFSDDFNRANTSSLGADYSEASGDWEITSNKLNPPADGVLKVTLSTPASPNGVKIKATMNSVGTGEMSLIVDYVDASNYHYVSVVATGATAGTMQIWKMEAGSPTALTTADAIPSFSWNTDYTLEVCWEEDRIGAAFTQGVNTLEQGAVTTGHGGNFTGLRTASANTSARFDDLFVTSLEEGCERCGEACTECEHDSFQVDIEDVTDALCADCANVNNSYIVRRIPPDADCAWGFGELEICTGLDHIAFLDMSTTGQALVAIATGDPTSWPDGVGAAELTWKSTSLSGPCADFVDEDLPFFSSGTFCTISTSTCKVTAL